MFRSDIKSAIRNILRNKVTSAISILGLGVGLGCIIVLTALIIHEKSFDKFIPGYNNVYRVLLGNTASTPYPLIETVAEESPSVKDFFRYYQANTLQIKTSGNEIIKESSFGFADPSIFTIMGLRFISGVPAGSLNEVAISDKSAMKYFGNLSPVGAVIHVKFSDGYEKLIVSGVYKSFPSNSTLDPSFLSDIKLSTKILRQFQKSLGTYGYKDFSLLDWAHPLFLSYIMLAENADQEELCAGMDKYREFLKVEDKEKLHYELQKVSDIYLGSHDINGDYFLRHGNKEELKYYEVISILILLISVANYMLLARAGVSERIRELGARKVFGASQNRIRQLIILEANKIVILSLIPAIFIIDYGMSFVNGTLNKTLTSQVFLNPVLWIMLILIVVTTGTLSGWLIGSGFSRRPTLKLISGKISQQGSSKKLSYSFLVFHFTIYMILVAGIITVSKQISYSLSGYKGIDPENVLVADLDSDELKNSFETICNEIEKIPGVKKAAGGSFIPPFGNYLPITLWDGTGEKIKFDGLIMGEGMTEILGIEVIEGSSFGQYKPESSEILLNESSAIKYNIKAGDNLRGFLVRRIVRDFNAHSLHTLIEPMVILQQNPERMGLIAIKTDGKNDNEVIKRLRKLYSQISPGDICEVSHLTDQINEFYGHEKNQAKIIGTFSILATILSVMGLFGISLISISGRKKEIGIRKVNRASASIILLMLNTDYLKWILISIIISLPASVYLLTKWLDRFAYKTELSWWIFASAGLSAMVIAIFTVSWQSWRAATRNPVEALRYE